MQNDRAKFKNVGATFMTPVITGLIRPKPFGFVCPTPTISKKKFYILICHFYFFIFIFDL